MKRTIKLPAGGVSSQRTSRLYKLLRLLEEGDTSKKNLLRRLQIGVRTLYRDIHVLRDWNIVVKSAGRKYHLETVAEWQQRLPFPNPRLNFAEAAALAASKAPGAEKMQALLNAMAP